MILKSQQVDRTGGMLYLKQIGPEYLITVENKNTNYYALLRSTLDRLSAERSFKHIYDAEADMESAATHTWNPNLFHDRVSVGIAQ